MRGNGREQSLSRQFHQEGLPVLVSAALLRERSLGQCDLVRFLPKRRLVEIWEVKGQHRALLSWGQQLRLKHSGLFLAKILGASVLLRVVGRD